MCIFHTNVEHLNSLDSSCRMYIGVICLELTYFGVWNRKKNYKRCSLFFYLSFAADGNNLLQIERLNGTMMCDMKTEWMKRKTDDNAKKDTAGDSIVTTSQSRIIRRNLSQKYLIPFESWILKFSLLKTMHCEWYLWNAWQ